MKRSWKRSSTIFSDNICLLHNSLLSCYPRATFVIYDNECEFKLHFEALCNSYGLVYKPALIKNPQDNDILKCMHAVISDIMCIYYLDMQDTVTTEEVADFITSSAWAISITYHTVLGSLPGQANFSSKMLFNNSYLVEKC